MRKIGASICGLILLCAVAVSGSDRREEERLPRGVPRFEITTSDMNLSRAARPTTYFDKVGRKFAILGFESGSFEAWAYPLKLLRGFEFSFLLGSSTVPIEGRDIVRTVSVEPAVTTLVFASQSFTVRAHYVAAVDDPGAVILLEVDSVESLTIVCSFIPVLQPMWPAGLGGQYASWDRGLKAYLISEPTRKNHGYVGSPSALGISITPAHMLSDAPNQFKIEIAEPKSVRGVYLPIVLAGGKGERGEVRAVYERIAGDPAALYHGAVEHFRRLRDSTLHVVTPVPSLNLAFEWAKVATDNLVVDNPDLGLGIVAGLGPSGQGGRPGFGWFFGGDAFLNSLSLNSLGAVETARSALAFSQKWQREDGKMAHELSQAAGYIDWWGDYPYGYIHGDTTPYYIVAMHDHFRRTDDLDFVRESWPSITRAFDWCLTTDGDGDGLMDNTRAGLGALEFGALTGIQTDIYLAAVWAKACEAMRDLAGAVGDKTALTKAGEAAHKARSAFDAKFWDSEGGRYSYAFNAEGALVPELTPWSAFGIAWGLGEPGRNVETLSRMNSSDLTTDWGVRMLSVRSPLFEPLNYNYGAAWPFLTGWVSAALFRTGFITQGYQNLMGTVRHTFDNALGSVTELYSGFQNVWPQEGVPHQGFCSSGVVIPLVRGLLGVDGDAVRKTITFAPRLPPDWPGISLSNLRIGGAVFAIDVQRKRDAFEVRIRTEKGGGWRVELAPAFGLGSRIDSAVRNGAPLDFQVDEAGQAQAAVAHMEFELGSEDTVVVAVRPAPEIVPPLVLSKTGDLNRGLRILRAKRSGKTLEFFVEGLSGATYTLDVVNGNLVESVTGADYKDGRLTVVIPPGNPGEFIPRNLVLTIKQTP
jgi:hypothetical protein